MTEGVLFKNNLVNSENSVDRNSGKNAIDFLLVFLFHFIGYSIIKMIDFTIEMGIYRFFTFLLNEMYTFIALL